MTALVPAVLTLLRQHHDLEQVRALLGHTRVDTTQIDATIRPVQLKRAVAFYGGQGFTHAGRIKPAFESCSAARLGFDVSMGGDNTGIEYGRDRG